MKKGLELIKCRSCGTEKYRVLMYRNYDICKPCSKRTRAERHGWSILKYNRAEKEQNNACAICKIKTDDLVIDHDHSSGYRRGLLCAKCNTGLGEFNDNPDLLSAAIEYLTSKRQTELKESLEKFEQTQKHQKLVVN